MSVHVWPLPERCPRERPNLSSSPPLLEDTEGSRVRALLLVLVLLAVSATPSNSADEPQVAWVSEWEEAFKLAKKTGKPVMVCINSKDGEGANERAAQKIYRGPWFISLSRHFVMIVVSTLKHTPKGACPRFGKVTCKQHVDCWKMLAAEHGEEFYIAGKPGDMISPQHAWFAPDGKLLQRKEYELTNAELLKRMRAVLAKLGRKVEDSGPALAPLDDKDRAELERIERGNGKVRRAALGKLLATGKIAAHTAIIDMLTSAKDPAVKCDLLRALGRAKALTARLAAEARLADKDAMVRSFAAVCLEELGLKDSVPRLIKRLKAERDATTSKNLCRALGACGGPTGDKAAAKALLAAVAKSRQKLVQKHAALALRAYAGTGAKLVRKRLQTAALRENDPTVRSAIVYALVYVGDKRTVRILEKVLAETRDKYSKAFVRSAIATLRGEKVPFSAGSLFWEDYNDPARKEDEETK